jgi:hypothetical protein
LAKSQIYLNEIFVYKYEIQLSSEFKSNGSLVKKKSTYLYFNPETQAIVEIPFSPSMGGTSLDLVTKCELVSRNLTWLNYDLSVFDQSKNSKTFEMQTFGIGQWTGSSTSQLIKLKGDASMLDVLIEQSHFLSAKNSSWIVDFNQGLIPKQLDYFIKSADLSTCFGIEQPLQVGLLDAYICDMAPIIFDEEMSEIDFKRVCQIKPKAVVLKPWRYTYSKYLEWHNLLIQNEIPYMVGSMIQGPVADHLCDTLNSIAPLRYNCKPMIFNLIDLLKDAEFLGTLYLE